MAAPLLPLSISDYYDIVFLFPAGLVVVSRGAPRGSDSPEIDQLEKLAHQLEAEGKCRLLKKITKPMYYHDGHEGLIWMYSPL